MTGSENTFDEYIDDVYPDPLSLNYLNFSITSGNMPVSQKLNMSNIQRLWKIPIQLYGRAELDDIVLTLNGVEHRNFLQVGDELLFPDEVDIDRSFTESI